MTTYILRKRQAILSIKVSVAARPIVDDVVAPMRGVRRQYQFTFRDMLMIRTANSLCEAKIPSHSSRALTRFKEDWRGE